MCRAAIFRRCRTAYAALFGTGGALTSGDCSQPGFRTDKPGAPASSRAQQRLYFWPEPQGHWAFRPGVGGALTVLQCEPGEAFSYQRSAVSFLAMRLVVGVFPMLTVRSNACIFGPSRRGRGRFWQVAARPVRRFYKTNPTGHWLGWAGPVPGRDLEQAWGWGFRRLRVCPGDSAAGRF